MEVKESFESGVFVKGLTLNVVKSIKEMETFMIQGQANRAVGET